MDTPQAGRQAEVLSVDKCWKYLESSYIGRLAVINGTVPEIFPINFMTFERTLFFRTAPGTKLRSLLAGTPVALETDGLNAYATEVWSVIVKGLPEPVSDNDMKLEMVDPNREPREPGLKEHLVRITPTQVTGAQVPRQIANTMVAASGFLIRLDHVAAAREMAANCRHCADPIDVNKDNSGEVDGWIRPASPSTPDPVN